jgi:N-acyl homoserine lactone hydrolase
MRGASVHRLHMASYKLAGRYNPPTFRDARHNVYAYVIRCDSQVILVDSGIGADNDFINRWFEPQSNAMADELARFNLRIADIRTVVNSHLHFDHCGNNRLFPGATVVVQQAELDIARAMGQRYTVPSWFDYDGARLSPVRGDTELAPSVTLLAAPGHTPGHQAVLVEGSRKRLLVAAQAAFSADEFSRGGDAVVQAHEGLAREYESSIARLAAIAADRTYFSHDTCELPRVRSP